MAGASRGGRVGAAILARGVALAAAALAGCSSTSIDNPARMCPSASQPRWVALQCESPPIDPSPIGDPAAGTLSGVVTAWSVGLGGCLAGQTYLADVGVRNEDGRVLTITTSAGSEQSFGLVIPGMSPPITVGDPVDVSYSIFQGGFSPSIVQIEVRKAGSLVLYVGAGGLPSDLMLPDGVSASLGARTCALVDECGTAARYTLSLDVDGTSASLVPGTITRVGRLSALVGESAQQTNSVTRCADWFWSVTTLALTP